MAGPTRARVRPPGADASRRVAVLMLVGLVALVMPFPWVGVALLPLGWGIVEAIRAIRALQAAQAGPGAQAWAIAGLGLVSMMFLSVAWPFLFFSSTMEYQQCLQGANTGAARAECRTSLVGPFSGGGVRG